jgi:hypothetical protein
MTDRLHDLVVGLQRMAESARARSDDLRYIQQRDTDEHLQWLDSLLAMVEKVRGVLIEERQAFMPVQREKPPLMPHQQDAARLPGRPQHPTHTQPQVVRQGPKEAAG